MSSVRHAGGRASRGLRGKIKFKAGRGCKVDAASCRVGVGGNAAGRRVYVGFSGCLEVCRARHRDVKLLPRGLRGWSGMRWRQRAPSGQAAVGMF
jgi:hypothetical protein